MKVNGETKSLGEVISLGEFLKKENYVAVQVAVERNGEIVPKAEYDQVMLAEDDVLEIVHFVGGGC